MYTGHHLVNDGQTARLEREANASDGLTDWDVLSLEAWPTAYWPDVSYVGACAAEQEQYCTHPAVIVAVGI